jgi:leucyl-tRNA synthetase
VDEEIDIAVQINGKFKGTVHRQSGCSDEDAVSAARRDEHIGKNLEGMKMVKSIYVKDKLVNLIVKPE